MVRSVTLMVLENTFLIDSCAQFIHYDCGLGTPTMFIDVLAAYDRAKRAGEKMDLSSMRDGITAGAPMPPEVMSRLIKDFHMTCATVRA